MSEEVVGPSSSIKPKGVRKAFEYYVQDRRTEEIRAGLRVGTFRDYRKTCGTDWANMDIAARKPYIELQERDKRRFEKEKRSYVPLSRTDGKRDAKNRDPNAPKGAVTSFIWFNHHERAKVKAAYPELGEQELSKLLGKMWEEMGADGRAQYTAMAAKDRARYDEEIQAYKGTSKRKAYAAHTDEKGDEDLAERESKRPKNEMKTIVSTGIVASRKEKKTKDPKAPKRGISAFFWFLNKNRAMVKAANPNFGLGDLSKELGKMWRELTPAAKAEYHSMATRDRARFTKDNEAYKRETDGVQMRAEGGDDDRLGVGQEDDEIAQLINEFRALILR